MSELFCAGKAKKCMRASFHSSPLRDCQLRFTRLFHLMDFCLMEGSFRAQSFNFSAMLFVRASTGLVQSVMLLESNKWNCLQSSRYRNVKVSGPYTNSSLGGRGWRCMECWWIYRSLLLLAISTAEMWGPIMTSLLLKFALSADWLPNRYSMQWEGEVESILSQQWVKQKYSETDCVLQFNQTV